jgi:hypothetical protein
MKCVGFHERSMRTTSRYWLPGTKRLR